MNSRLEEIHRDKTIFTIVIDKTIGDDKLFDVAIYPDGGVIENISELSLKLDAKTKEFITELKTN